MLTTRQHCCFYYLPVSPVFLPQVPWTALRSPVVVELSDVHLCIALRRDDELTESPAAERSWLAKQAELAAAELAALAAANGGDSSSGAGGRAGGVLWSFVQHVLAMLVNRLQLSVSNVHVEFEVGGVPIRSFEHVWQRLGLVVAVCKHWAVSCVRRSPAIFLAPQL